MMKENKNLGSVPSWSLVDLYGSLDDEEINGDLQKLTTLVINFVSYRNNVKNLDAQKFYTAMVEYEKILELNAKLSSFAHLKYTENLSLDRNLKFHQTIKEELTKLSSQILFFELEINNLEESRLNNLYRYSKDLSFYKQAIDDMRTFKPHQLTEDMEKLLLEKNISGASAWVRLFDETIDNMEFKYNGNTYNESQFLQMMNGKSEKVRRKTSKIFGETLGKHAKLFAYITNVLAKDKETNDEWRKFKTPISSRNLSNLIEDEVVENLRNVVKENYKNTSHRYYKWKAKQLRKKKLHYSDRNAPLPVDNNKEYKWGEAKDIVLEAYNDFSPEMAKIGEEFFKNNWIDAQLRKGKSGGAFMSPTIPAVHPYILMNYTGRSRDIMTLAHELGHGIHQTLADKNGYLFSSPPLTLAETASVFGEQLTFRKLLASADKKTKKAILANKVEDMLNTVVRQIAFLEFETRVHNERRGGEIPIERLNQIWLDVQKESLGEDNFIFDDEYKYYWSYIPHFIHSPFYVYAYAFGDCLVNSLYRIYQTQPEGFQEKYLELLKTGSAKRYDEVLKIFNFDPKNPEFWQGGIDVIIELIDELEKMK